MNNEALLALVLTSVPGVLALIRDARTKQNPDAAPVTDAEVFAALGLAVVQILAKGEAWKAAHPPELER